MQRGSLRAVLMSEEFEFEWEEHGSMVVDVAKGMLYLATFQPPLLHRDLKVSALPLLTRRLPSDTRPVSA